VYQHVSLIFALVLAKVAHNWVLLRFKVALLFSGATWKDCGFVTNSGWEEGLGCQITQFVSYIIVTKDNETAFLAPWGMMDTKLLPATITM
jgi:hypothetical protein